MSFAALKQRMQILLWPCVLALQYSAPRTAWPASSGFPHEAACRLPPSPPYTPYTASKYFTAWPAFLGFISCAIERVKDKIILY